MSKIGIIVDLKVREGVTAEAETILQELAAAVATEPGNERYVVTKNKKDPLAYRIFEIYASSEAAEFHRTAKHTKEIFPKLMPLLDGGPKVDLLDIVAGSD